MVIYRQNRQNNGVMVIYRDNRETKQWSDSYIQTDKTMKRWLYTEITERQNNGVIVIYRQTKQ